METLPFGIGAYFTCGKSLPNFLRNFPPFGNFHNYFLSGVLALERVGQCLLLFSCFGYNRRKHQSLPWQEKVQDKVTKARCNKIAVDFLIEVSREVIPKSFLTRAAGALPLSPAYSLSRQQRQTLPTPHPAHPMIYALHTHAPHTHTQTHTHATDTSMRYTPPHANTRAAVNTYALAHTRHVDGVFRKSLAERAPEIPAGQPARNRVSERTR